MKKIASASTAWNATLRTTCVATQLEGGHAMNALPQLAAATVNCRVLPEDSADYVLTTLKRVIHGRSGQRETGADDTRAPAPPRPCARI